MSGKKIIQGLREALEHARSDEPQADAHSGPYQDLRERLTEAASYINDLKSDENIPDDVQGSLYDTLTDAASALLTLQQERDALQYKLERLKEEYDDLHRTWLDACIAAEHHSNSCNPLARTIKDIVAEREGYLALAEALQQKNKELEEENELCVAECDARFKENSRLRASIETLRRGMEDLLGESGKGNLTVRDLCYTAFMKAKGTNDEDGGPTDWFTDTLPIVEKGIERMRRAALSAEQAGETG